MTRCTPDPSTRMVLPQGPAARPNAGITADMRGMLPPSRKDGWMPQSRRACHEKHAPMRQAQSMRVPVRRPTAVRSRRPPGARTEVVPSLRLWVVYGGRIKFGHGRAELLRLIHELGSIREAASQAGMSYRNLWGYLQELERASGMQLLLRQRGRGPTAGTRLSPDGEAFLARYWRFRQAVDRAVSREFARVYATR